MWEEPPEASPEPSPDPPPNPRSNRGPEELGHEPPNSSEEYPSGMDELEREIAELLNSPPTVELSGGPVPPTTTTVLAPMPVSPPVPMPMPAPPAPSPPGLSPSETERILRSEILRLRATLDVIRRDVAEHRAAVAGVHGEIERVHSVLSEMRTEGDRRSSAPALSAPASGPSSPTKTISAAPVFFMGPEGRNVQAQAFFTLGKGGALESFLTRVLREWEDSGYAIETRGGVDGFTLKLLDDPEGRGLRLLPSGMYLMQLGQREIAELEQLPPLVSSKSWPKNGGFMER